ncbi:MAG: tRNA preQ1(34) S-adenosylmethionine ribosyltransferase-isomerase QueA [Candidatus Aminicenantes bacterium]|nr:tRNA preQ1(34) S-adenosylmethionine ribosyltransferase-isomerase QueA [Candidatus Aminicenantes bacterium]
MLVSDFDYSLPPELIAQRPLPHRDESRMMVLHRKSQTISHHQFLNFPEYLNNGDVLVLNSSKVIPARIWGRKKESEIEFLFLAEIQKGVWEVLCRPAKKLDLDDTIRFSDKMEGKVAGLGPEGIRIIRFKSGNIIDELNRVGYPPLPPYIKRNKFQTDLRTMDLKRYQTVFAHKPGSIAAPTAGLHFTKEVLHRIADKGVEIVEIILDVGLATFQPVRVRRVQDHRMLTERFSISPKAARIINAAKIESKPVVAVGTTTVRTLESAARIHNSNSGHGEIKSGTHATDLFIYPGHEFKIPDRLLTNFHLPQSTLLMLVAAFADKEFILRAYREAVRLKYRFYSYGDCMLIL